MRPSAEPSSLFGDGRRQVNKLAWAQPQACFLESTAALSNGLGWDASPAPLLLAAAYGPIGSSGGEPKRIIPGAPWQQLHQQQQRRPRRGSAAAAGRPPGAEEELPPSPAPARGAPPPEADNPSSGGEGGHDGPAVRAALALLKFYRTGLSPLMQSTCRFLPTCSAYSMDAYRAHGVWKGTVLTAWRLLRCNPWGGSGYDPVSWPPVGLGPLFAWDGSAPLAVVAGAALVLRLGHALLFE